MSDYPIPSYACSIWLAGDSLWLAFPPLAQGEHGHSVPFPATERGLELILNTLRQRRLGERSLGEAGSPTRYQIERSLVNDANYNVLIGAIAQSKEAQRREREEAGKFLEELGL